MKHALAAALLGGGLGLGTALVFAGLWGSAVPRTAVPRSWNRQKLARGRARRRSVAAVVGAVLWLVTGWPVAGLSGAAFVVGLPWLRAAGTVAARRIERLEALEDWLRHLADVLGSGSIGLVSALQGSAHDAPSAIAAEVTALAQRLRTWNVQTALLTFADELDDQVGDTAAAGLCVAHQQGAGVADLLTTLASQVADEVNARRTAEAERARRRSTAQILLGLWAAMFAGFATFGSTAYTAAYDSPLGQLVLAVVVGLVAGSAVWLRRLGIEPAAPRFLASPTRRPS
ncbi:type II secretion system F family protein [Amycolatopsis magusensis]|uniref:type II secretion system F family protein n=1 Tax=Amycolatopsis magusensis TaxID=882444 RepID=UPI003799B64E